MELRHLRYFVAVAEGGTIARAAARLHISESPLSRQIVDLERDLGVELFERLPRGMRLTPAGAGFLSDARQLLADAARATGRAQATAGTILGALRVGYSETPGGPAPAIVQAATLAFRARHPEVRLVVDVTPQVRQKAEVRAGRLDLGFTFDLVEDPALASESIARVAASGAVLSAAHPAAGDSVVSLESLRALPLLTFPHTVARSQFADMRPEVQALGFASEPRDDVGNCAAGFALIGSGAAWGIAGEWIKPCLRMGVVFRPVEGMKNFVFEERMVWRRASATPALLAFVAVVAHERDRTLATADRTLSP